MSFCVSLLQHIREFAPANDDDVNNYNELTNTYCLDSQVCLSGGFEENYFSSVMTHLIWDVSAAVTFCKKIAISKSDIEPTVLNLYFSQWLSQINQTTSCTHPLQSVCGLLPWRPVQLLLSYRITAIHQGEVRMTLTIATWISLPLISGWVRSCCVDSLLLSWKKHCLSIGSRICLHVFPLLHTSLANSHSDHLPVSAMPWQ